MKCRILLLCLFWCSVMLPASATTTPSDEIIDLINRQQQAWNKGDIPAYMEGYWHDKELVFSGTGEFRYGWETLLNSYEKSYPTTETMGKITLITQQVKILTDDVAVVSGSWSLTRKKDQLKGVFTLVVEKKNEKWVITHDHSS